MIIVVLNASVFVSALISGDGKLDQIIGLIMRNIHNAKYVFKKIIPTVENRQKVFAWGKKQPDNT